jgi:hypothetical protein
LDELVAFGLLRRDRLRSEGTVIGLAYWLKLAPRKLTGAAIQRIKERLCRSRELTIHVLR